ncbi:MAG: DUF1501 domain-containing protein [Planctomycetota bacterium]
MLQVQQRRGLSNCQGMDRRTAIKAGVLGLSGLSLADLMKLRAEGTARKNDKSVILIWLDGGLSQLESYDPKPESPSEYRGPWGAIPTNVPGIFLSETLPFHAKHADKMAFVRSLHHGTGDHFAGAHWMLTGRFGSTSASLPQKFPSVGSYVSRVRGPNKQGLPAYVGLPAAESVYLFPGYQGAAYLGSAYNPFDVDTESKYLHYSYNVAVGRPRCLDSFTSVEASRAETRKSLLTGLDGIERRVDQSGVMNALDRYQQDAMSMILGGQAKRAFNLDLEDPRVADKYGRNPWGRYTLMARRLVEAGVTFVTVDMPHWDDHSNIKVGHGGKLEVVDRAIGALMDDLIDRDLLDRTLVLVMSEFGRTPRINTGQPGIPIPGRDHWGDAISVMLAGGGIRGGTVVGATNSKAEFPMERPLKPHDLLATVYKVMGIDPQTSFKDFAGRPVPILTEGEAIHELL